MLDQEFIKSVESSYFRTTSDIGANENALFIWNLVRGHAGLSKLTKADLPTFCEVHRRYHVIREEYGCLRSGEKPPTKRQEIYVKVKNILVEQLGLNPEQVTLEASLIEDFGADSLDLVELTMAFEGEFNFESDDEKTEKIQTVGEIVDYIESLNLTK